MCAAVSHSPPSVAELCTANDASEFQPCVNLEGLTPDHCFQVFTGIDTSNLDPQTLADLSGEHAKCSASEMFTRYGNRSAVQNDAADLSTKAGGAYFGPLADLDAGWLACLLLLTG